MLAVVPEWVMHGTASERTPIYSCHVNPAGTHLATGGADCRVKIWSVERVLDGNSTSPTMLSTNKDHSEPVNCVRWSPCGNFLATCSGDKMVFVLQRGVTFSKPIVLLGETEANHENWEEHSRFTGHTLDVLHVAWCPKTPGRLASCGIDCSIFVWQVGSREPIKKVETKYPCKGISWDPIGIYLAAQVQGEEKTVEVWRVRDWKLESKNVKGFQSPDDTQFLRPSWSPDGQFLATTNAFERKSYACALLDRSSGQESNDSDCCEGWTTNATFKGWKAPVTVAAFHPKFLKAASGELDFCVAVGSQESQLTLWSTLQTEKPLLVVKHMFEKEIYDVTWGGVNAFVLAACSCDGSVALIQVDEEEIGKIASEHEVKKHLAECYPYMAHGMADMDLAEDISQVKFEQQHVPNARAAPAAMAHTVMTEQVVRSTQQESKVNGRRKIAPALTKQVATVSLESTTTLASAGAPTSAPGATSLASDPAAVANSGVLRLSGGGGGGTGHPNGVAADGATMNRPDAVRHTEMLENGGPGAPTAADEGTAQKTMGISSIGAFAKTAPKSPQRQGGGGAGEGTALAVVQPTSASTIPNNAQPQQQLVNGGKSTGSLGKRSAEGKEGKELSKKKKDGAGGAAQGAVAIMQGPLIQPKGPKLSDSFQLSAPDDSPSGQSMYLETARNLNGTATSITCKLGDGHTLWSDMIRENVVMLAGNEHMSVVATADCALYFFSKHGRRLLPAVILSAQVAHLQVLGAPANALRAHVVVITSDGMLRAWDASALQETCSISLASLLRDVHGAPSGAVVERVWLSSAGLPVVAMSSGSCYAYHPGMKVMMRIADDHFQASSLSSLSSLTSQRSQPSSVALPVGPLTRAIEVAKRNFKPQTLPGIISMDDDQQSQQTIAHAETCLASAIVLESRDEFKHWLSCYSRLLVDSIREGESGFGEARLRELCEYIYPPSLMTSGASGAGTADTRPERKILGHLRTKLLEDLIRLMRTNRGLQRVVAEFELYARPQA